MFIPEYAKNFNKGLSAEDIKFCGKIHFNRDRSNNELNMHCHLIVSRKDQSNKIKISPLTNHRNTKKGAITGGFDCTTLFQRAEKGFDKLFGYNRKLSETFEYCNTMKNDNLTDKLKMQEKEIGFAGEKKNTADEQTGKNIKTHKDENIKMQTNTNLETDLDIQTHQQTNESGLSSLFSILPSAADINLTEEQQPPNPKKKKKRKPRLRQ